MIPFNLLSCLRCLTPKNLEFLKVVSVVGQCGQDAAFILIFFLAAVIQTITTQSCHVAVECKEYGISCTEIPLLDCCGVYISICLSLHHCQGLVAYQTSKTLLNLLRYRKGIECAYSKQRMSEDQYVPFLKSHKHNNEF